MTSTLPRSHALWARLLVTLAVVVVYRLGVWIPLPTIDPEKGFSSFGNSLGSFLGGRLSAGLLSTSRSSPWGSPLI
jgi:preprotein translocase subunit SecY